MKYWRRATVWAANQARRSWWVLPLQPIVTVAVLAAGILAAWPGLEFETFHDRLGEIAGHGWLVLGVAAPLMTLVSYWLILRRRGMARYWGFWIRLAGDFGQAVVLAVFIMLHATDTGSEEDVYVTAIFTGLLAALGLILVRDVWEIVLTEQLAGRLHRNGHRNGHG